MIHGRGIFYYSDGSVYAGQFDSNKRHGQGDTVSPRCCGGVCCCSGCVVWLRGCMVELECFCMMSAMLRDVVFKCIIACHLSSLGIPAHISSWFFTGCFTSKDGNT